MAVLIGSATGGTGADWNASLFGAGSKRTALSSGTLRSVWMHKKATDAATLANAELGIYADDGGGTLPGTLLGKCRLGSLPKGVNKFGVTLATPVTLVSGTSYWLAWWQQGATQYNWQGDVGGVGYTEANVGTGGLPAPFSGSNQNVATGFTPIIWGEDTVAPWIVAESALADGSGDRTSHAVPYPAPTGGILANDLLICCVGMDSAASGAISWPGSWTEILDTRNATNAVNGACAWLRAAGGETGTFTVTSSATENGGIRCFCIRNAHTTTAPEVASATGSSTNPDAPSLDPTGWDTPENTLWIAAAANDANVLASAAPTGYHGFGATRGAHSTTTSRASVATAWTQTTAASENPGTFTAATDPWVAWTVAVRPASTAGAVVVPLNAASAVGTGTLATRAPTQIPLVAASAVASRSATVTIPSAAAVVPLASSSAVGSAALALRAPTVVAVNSSASVATATAALRAPTVITLATALATATGTVSLRAPPSVALAASTAVATATAGFRAPALLTLTASASATGTLALTTGAVSAAVIPLNAAPATATGTLALRAPATLPMAASAASVSGALAISYPTAAIGRDLDLVWAIETSAAAILPLAPASAQATGSLSLFVPGVAFISITGAAQASATLALRAPAVLSLAPAPALATGLLALTSPASLLLSASSAQGSASLTLRAIPVLSLSASAQATGTLALLTRGNLILSASATATGTLTLFVPTVGPVTLLLAPSQALGGGLLALGYRPRLILATTATASGSLVVISTSLLEKHPRLYLEVTEQNLGLRTMITESQLHLLVSDPGVVPTVLASIDERFYTVVVDERPMRVQVTEVLGMKANIDIPEDYKVEVDE